MEQPSGAESIRKSCNAISLELMKIHPAVPKLGHKEAQDELYKILYRLTTEVESVKKLLRRVEGEQQGAAL